MNNKEKEVIEFDRLLEYERKRYKSKGYGIVVAILITVSFFFLFPRLAKLIYPKQPTWEEGTFFFTLLYAAHEGSFLLIGLIMTIIYKANLNFFEKYKTTSEPWPWEEDQAEWRKLLRQTLKLLALNHLVVFPLITINYIIYNYCPYELDYNLLPDSFTMIGHILFFIVIEDFAFYWGHRILHTKYLYSKIHKVHHIYKKVVFISFEFAHPIEFVFVNVVPSVIGPLILGKRTHLVTYLAWIIIRVMESADGHCGYEFSWSPYRLLFMSAGQDYHNFHHLYFKDNYGSFFTFWDRMCGTVSHRYKEFTKQSKIKEN